MSIVSVAPEAIVVVPVPVWTPAVHWKLPVTVKLPVPPKTATRQNKVGGGRALERERICQGQRAAGDRKRALALDGQYGGDVLRNLDSDARRDADVVGRTGKRVARPVRPLMPCAHRAAVPADRAGGLGGRH